MNQVPGKVFDKETGVGMSDLLVELYNVFPATRTEEVFRDGVLVGPDRTPVRLASGLTASDGSINLEYEYAAFQRRKPDQHGTFRDAIPAEEIKPLLFGSLEDSQRPTFLLRENPADVLRPTQPPPVLVERSRPSVSAPGGNGANGGGPGAGLTALNLAAAGDSRRDRDRSETITPESVPDFVARLCQARASA